MPGHELKQNKLATPDGESHPGFLIAQVYFFSNDLAVLMKTLRRHPFTSLKTSSQ
jgi:hypothetical protein